MRKKRLLLIFTFFYSIILADEVDETRDIRKYHQQLEERVFEVENKEEQDNKIKESFSHGKRRIENAIKNEEMKLEEEDKKTSEKLENLKIAEEKYDELLKEMNKLIEEKEKLIKENQNYIKKLEEEFGRK